jgi:ABC-type glycerol-3-phosphate transport system substrate-binding protein
MVNGADTKVLTAIASGLIPDAGTINQTQAPSFYKSGMACDLTPLIQADKFDISILPPSPESLQYQGRWYGMPQAGSAFGGRAIYYNRNMISEAGLVNPTFKWTLNDFTTYVQKLSLDKQNDGVYERVGYNFGPLEWPIYIWSGGGDIMNDAHTDFTLTSTKSVAALEFWAEFTRKGLAAQPLRNFGAGTTAMRTGAFFEASNFVEQNLSFDWSVVEFPIGPAGSVNRRGTHPWVIPVESHQITKT